MIAQYLHVFSHRFSPVIQNICVKEKRKKSNSLPAVMFHLQMFFLLPPVSSKFCSSATSSVRLEGSSYVSSPFCSTITATKGMDFSQNTGHMNGAELKWELV